MFYKLLFFIIALIGTLISISSNSWLGMWIGLEINLLSIIPLMNNNNNSLSTEASLKYFVIQALASMIILFSIIMSMNCLINGNYLMMMMNSALSMKMGMAPFHFWFPSVMEGLNWSNCLILMTVQKIAPMILLMYNINFSIMMTIIIIISMVIAGIMGFNQISLRKILAYSSINHMAWMIASMFLMEITWIYYFFIYIFITANIVIFLKMFNIFYLMHFYISIKKHMMISLLFMSNLLSLGGLPPFLGFLPKWMTIQNLIESDMFFLTFLMIMLTLITLYYYIRVSLSMMILNFYNMNFTLKMNFMKFWSLGFNFFMLISLCFSTFLFNLI
uniref:NADH-ubiquinone oxidoreductase chain 2 n=1 Tax=Staphylinidae sp. 1 EF-2015 TaxID=1756865 RepID=A0A0S2M8X0_9COLE|nr:NADH deshydrogenase subunit 2 [Staphylinidae sp. 1 EF-2015]